MDSKWLCDFIWFTKTLIKICKDLFVYSAGIFLGHGLDECFYWDCVHISQCLNSSLSSFLDTIAPLSRILPLIPDFERLLVVPQCGAQSAYIWSLNANVRRRRIGTRQTRILIAHLPRQNTYFIAVNFGTHYWCARIVVVVVVWKELDASK